MAAKNKKTARRGATDREPVSQESFGLHLTASQHRDELLAEARALQTAGKIREARKRLRAAQEIQHRLTALETEVRLSARDAAPAEDH
jgi:hypothetical protein